MPEGERRRVLGLLVSISSEQRHKGSRSGGFSGPNGQVSTASSTLVCAHHYEQWRATRGRQVLYIRASVTSCRTQYRNSSKQASSLLTLLYLVDFGVPPSGFSCPGSATRQRILAHGTLAFVCRTDGPEQTNRLQEASALLDALPPSTLRCACRTCDSVLLQTSSNNVRTRALP
jgi:hypothetical protein